jgi:hypothetical protein
LLGRLVTRHGGLVTLAKGPAANRSGVPHADTWSGSRCIKPPPERLTIATIRTFEEKGSDVNLAAYALADAYEGRADKVVLLTNDSDLATPAQLLRDRGTTVGVIIPKKGLRSNTVPADFYKTLRPGDLAACHLPDPARDRAGRPVSKPVGW